MSSILSLVVHISTAALSDSSNFFRSIASCLCFLIMFNSFKSMTQFRTLANKCTAYFFTYFPKTYRRSMLIMVSLQLATPFSFKFENSRIYESKVTRLASKLKTRKSSSKYSCLHLLKVRLYC